MSLTNIKLPDFVIADLYRQTLIEPEGPISRSEPHIVAEQQPVTKTPVAESVAETPPVKEPPPAKTAEQPVAYKILGNNKKQITVVVNCPNDVFVPEADLQFLTKMLGACKLNMADVAIVNHATTAIAIERIKMQLQPKYLLLFGVEPGVIQLPISFPPFKEQAYAGTTYLYTPSLGQLNLETEEAKGMKRKLWDCLKRMFL
ncbi:hypothetical protein FAM09_07825 [Niastella caeni]|uniref:Uracil-DNA glycosylase-like domain-containing protein n=1 Tax=Niastella caeni TaxID=2569763 RepID=A0A4V6T3T9_9BACT|nr:hypothetical protein [Niastella caeni]THU39796.1 hypothetical protein FAM09_07825 [Niastella caeni]